MTGREMEFLVMTYSNVKFLRLILGSIVHTILQFGK